MRRIALLWVLLLLLTPACKASPGRTWQEAAFHQTHLADGETKALAAQLLDVPGYEYADASAQEERSVAAILPSANDEAASLTAISLHHVVDERGTPVGRLRLWKWSLRLLPEDIDADNVPDLLASPPSARTSIAGQPVYLFEDPEHPLRRYTYAWYREAGILAEIQGEDSQRLLTWVRAYLTMPEQTS
jgi:hypothetical protein